MRKIVSDRMYKILACPYCGGDLERFGAGVKCLKCREEFKKINKKQLDFRLRKKKSYQLQFNIGKNPDINEGFNIEVLKKKKFPQVDYSNNKVPSHLTKELISHFPKAKDNEIMLDLGCGSTIHKEVCEHAGFEYVGLDYDSLNASILGDAHAIPFKNNSFRFILSIAMLEHIQYPFIVIKEVYRVLEPKGIFIGSVAFLEPFHLKSYYHHTHLGVLNLLNFAGFDIKYISPNAKWTVLKAQSNILFPGLPRQISKGLIMPLSVFHRIWWKIIYFLTHSIKVNEIHRLLRTTGSFFFIAKKK
ncbi:hypothetical protein LCGC14_0965230 [marine sediment metagenome]|uniref:Methyltransferase type 11 domain-containing protein n=1 Tax=marine sediment metagenome TaxID=412755 RepID=A0A0F9RJT8_9ZZZZ